MKNGNEIDRNKAKNIYDFAGNVWEWTTETEIHDATHIGEHNGKELNKTFVVVRGGCYEFEGNGFGDKCGSVVVRRGGCLITDSNFNIGFRVVLYVK